MKTMVISEFKAKCIATLKEVQQLKRPVLVTLRGKPLARVVPASEPPHEKRLGGLKGSMRIRRDLVHADTSGDWEMLR
jgi:prevent-host-death family protein